MPQVTTNNRLVENTIKHIIISQPFLSWNTLRSYNSINHYCQKYVSISETGGPEYAEQNQYTLQG